MTVSQRQLKASENIRKILADIFTSGTFITKDLFEISLSINEIKLSPDLSNATIYVMPLASSITKEELVSRLNEANHKIRHLVAQKLYAKKVPNLLFKYENTESKQDQVLDLIKKLTSVE